MVPVTRQLTARRLAQWLAALLIAASVSLFPAVAHADDGSTANADSSWAPLSIEDAINLYDLDEGESVGVDGGYVYYDGNDYYYIEFDGVDDLGSDGDAADGSEADPAAAEDAGAAPEDAAAPEAPQPDSSPDAFGDDVATDDAIDSAAADANANTAGDAAGSLADADNGAAPADDEVAGYIEYIEYVEYTEYVEHFDSEDPFTPSEFGILDLADPELPVAEPKLADAIALVDAPEAPSGRSLTSLEAVDEAWDADGWTGWTDWDEWPDWADEEPELADGASCWQPPSGPIAEAPATPSYIGAPAEAAAESEAAPAAGTSADPHKNVTPDERDLPQAPFALFEEAPSRAATALQDLGSHAALATRGQLGEATVSSGVPLARDGKLPLLRRDQARCRSPSPFML